MVSKALMENLSLMEDHVIHAFKRKHAGNSKGDMVENKTELFAAHEIISIPEQSHTQGFNTVIAGLKSTQAISMETPIQKSNDASLVSDTRMPAVLNNRFNEIEELNTASPTSNLGLWHKFKVWFADNLKVKHRE